MVAVLHPGAMGAAIGAQLVSIGLTCVWVPDGRGPASHRRAESAGLVSLSGIDELGTCAVVVSVCPPAAALEVAEAVAQTGFTGCYVDANAISPRHSRDIMTMLESTGATVVDGGIVGPPPREPGTTLLCLSGEDDAVQQVYEMFRATAVQLLVVPGPVGSASALKLAFATYNKVSHVLAAQAYALAERHGVEALLRELAEQLLPETPLARPDSLVSAGQRAWRWEPEMREIGDACRDEALPDDLLHAAEAFLAHWRRHKNDSDLTVPRLLAALVHPGR
jgi:3-hydroxyisobutyrate dehydrogenase-like beta-hydroxyacid dehydrogenase